MALFNEGEPVSAGKLNAIAEAGRGKPGDGLHRYNGAYALAGDWEGWIKLTSVGTSGVYSWIEQEINNTGSIVDGLASGTIAGGDGAREVNGNSDNPVNTRVYAWRLGQYLYFQSEYCS